MTVETWLPVIIAAGGSFLSGYFGIRIGLARMDERMIALTERVTKLEARIEAKELESYRWRHDEYAPMINEIWADVRPIKAIVERLERFIHPPK